MTIRQHIIIYTDGACSKNPGPGGWGVYLRHPSSGKVKEISGGEKFTTNQKMELKAAVEALKTLKGPCHIEFFSDSKYVLNGITLWIESWKKKGWKNSKKEEVKNKELWIELDNLSTKFDHFIDWQWVKGHSGDPGNERADFLATSAVPKK